ILKTMSLFFGFLGLQMAYSAVYQASGNTNISMALAIVMQWGVQIPLAYFLSRHYGFPGIWLAFPITNISATLISYFIFRSSYWEKKKVIAENEQKLQEKVQQETQRDEIIPWE
ncbi:MAG TPA: MATE family efflux transporter, partial [Candidatus Gracilibacteria bacterium]|nr:MATE family efflux transporter [Candidatus Gracilibacteria bacterium]